MWLLSPRPLNLDGVLRGAHIFARGDVFPVFSNYSDDFGDFSICRSIFFCLVPKSSALFLPDFGNQLLFVFHRGAAFPCTNPVQNWFSEKEQLLFFWWKTLSLLWTKQWPSVPGCCGLL